MCAHDTPLQCANLISSTSGLYDFISIGVSLNKHLRKEEVILRKQHCFRRITGSCRRLYKTTASEESSYALKTKTSEVYPLTKTVADYTYGTKGTDTRHVGLNKDRDNM
ncbi:hypothetical protein E3N88_37761 [Mikania micrantha]|uniref:Uncharacterized protein n=1 Tax=Mikania micrantha TaxID=192012 RepID=A0A5N6LS36_9ASTR|nr:hypothetical protein E3N88_37761 [Mikania micrantha]